MLEPNPYQSPNTDTNTPQEVRPRRFRWRLIPTVFLAIFGGLLTITGPLMILQFLVAAIWYGKTVSTIVVLATFWMGLIWCAVGVVWCYSAAWWWQGRWRRAVVGTLAGGLLYAVAALLANLLGMP